MHYLKKIAFLGILFSLCLDVAYGDGKIFVSQKQWLFSRYEKTAIQHNGYDYAPSVMVENGVYRMWWCGSAPSGPNPYLDHIWMAKSVDGLKWTGIGIALPPEPLALISDPSVIRVGNTYFMYFTGTRDSGGSYNEIYLATSSDGENWKKYPDNNSPKPILSLDNLATGYGIGQPSVLFRQNRFWMYYTDTTREGGGLFLASSLDGITFVPENGGKRLLATNSADVKYSETLGLFVMVHGNSPSKLFYSASTDGILWEPFDTERYLAHGADKNKAFEGCLAGSPTGTMGRWAYYYYASHQGTIGKIEDPMSWDIEIGRLSFSALPSSSTVYQFHTKVTAAQGYYLSTDPVTPPYFDYQRRPFLIDTDGGPGLSLFFHLYQSTLKDHFYTSSEDEKKNSYSLGYQHVDNLGYISPASIAGTVPLYRLYNPLGAHFYTTSVVEREQKKSAGFRDEGIAAYVWPVDTDILPSTPTLSPARLKDIGTQVLSLSHDLGAISGAFDIRAEISYADKAFHGDNPEAVDTQARYSKVLVGNQGQIDITLDSYPAGHYLFRIAALDENGLAVSTYSSLLSFDIMKTVVDYPPFGAIDTPPNKTSTKGPLLIQGWALDDQGVLKVQVSIDNGTLQNAVIGLPRPDVARILPTLPNADKSGFRLETNIYSLAEGEHSLRVILTDTTGQTTTLGPRTVTLVRDANKAPFGVIDGPTEMTSSEGPLSIHGWALDDAGVSDVRVFIDNQSIGSAVRGYPRPDVRAAFPSMPNAESSGFRLETNISRLTSGNHSLTLQITDSAGAVTAVGPRTFVVVNGGNRSPFGNLEVPSEGTSVSTAFSLSGWALDDRAVDRVEVRLDDVLLTQMTAGDTRADVARAFPGYPNNTNAGFHVRLACSSWAAGRHSLTVRIYDRQGLFVDLPARTVVK